jgi:hypothetical protein
MIGFIGTSLQLHSILTAYNQWLSTSRWIPFWTTSCFTSTVTNDERRIPAHTLNCHEGRLSHEWILKSLYGCLYRLVRIHGNPLSQIRCHENVLIETFATKEPRFSCCLRYRGNVLSEILPSKWSYSGFQASCHNTYWFNLISYVWELGMTDDSSYTLQLIERVTATFQSILLAL